MTTIARGTKAGGGTNLNAGQTADPAEVNTDFNTIYSDYNGSINGDNIATATIPGSKSLRFTEISNPSTPSTNDLLLYAKAVAGVSVPSTVLATRDDGGRVFPVGNFVVLATSLGETTTATGAAVDLVTLTPSQSIQTNYWWGISANIRRTNGFAAAPTMGLKVNGTQIFNNFAVFTAGATTELGTLTINWVLFGAQAANYTQGGSMLASTGLSGGAQTNYVSTTFAAQLPNAAVTAVILTGSSANAGNTLGVANAVLFALIPFTV